MTSVNNSEQDKITRDVMAALQARAQIIERVVKNTRKTLEDFRKRREELISALSDALAENVNLRRKDFNTMMENVLATQFGRENTIRKTLEDFQRDEEVMTGELKKLLDKGEKVKIKDFRSALRDIQTRQREREAKSGQLVGDVTSQIEAMSEEVGNMLAEFQKEREKVVSEWQAVVESMEKAGFPKKLAQIKKIKIPKKKKKLWLTKK